MAINTKKAKKQEAKSPENKFGIKVVDTSSDTVHGVLGITKERWDVLTSKAEPIVNRIMKTQRPRSNEIILEVSALCDNATELAVLLSATFQSITKEMNNNPLFGISRLLHELHEM